MKFKLDIIGLIIIIGAIAISQAGFIFGIYKIISLNEFLLSNDIGIIGTLLGGILMLLSSAIRFGQ